MKIKHFKRMLSILVALLLLFTTIPAISLTASAEASDSYVGYINGFWLLNGEYVTSETGEVAGTTSTEPAEYKIWYYNGDFYLNGADINNTSTATAHISEDISSEIITVSNCTMLSTKYCETTGEDGIVYDFYCFNECNIYLKQYNEINTDYYAFFKPNFIQSYNKLSSNELRIFGGFALDEINGVVSPNAVNAKIEAFLRISASSSPDESIKWGNMPYARNDFVISHIECEGSYMVQNMPKSYRTNSSYLFTDDDGYLSYGGKKDHSILKVYYIYIRYAGVDSTVNFVVPEGTTTPESVKLNEGASFEMDGLTLPEPNSVEAYTTNWYTDEQCTQRFYEDTMVYKDTTLYGKVVDRNISSVTVDDENKVYLAVAKSAVLPIGFSDVSNAAAASNYALEIALKDYNAKSIYFDADAVKELVNTNETLLLNYGTVAFNDTTLGSTNGHRFYINHNSNYTFTNGKAYITLRTNSISAAHDIVAVYNYNSETLTAEATDKKAIVNTATTYATVKSSSLFTFVLGTIEASCSDFDPMTMAYGAQMRLTSVSGIRYLTNMSETDYAKAIALGSSVTIGTLITPDSYLGGDYNALKLGFAKQYLNVTTTGFFQPNTVAGSIIDIRDSNKAVKFVGRGYMKIKMGTESKELYASYASDNGANNSRSVAFIAKMLRDDTESYNALSASKKLIVDGFAAAYIG